MIMAACKNGVLPGKTCHTAGGRGISCMTPSKITDDRMSQMGFALENGTSGFLKIAKIMASTEAD